MMIESYDALRDILFKQLSEAEKIAEDDRMNNPKAYKTSKVAVDALMKVVNEAELGYDYRLYKEGTLDNGKMVKDKFMEMQLKFFPNANKTVLTFIYDFYTAHGNDTANMEYMRSTFHAGYCYYFAVILKAAFNRGKLCWAAPFGHIVWQDDDDIVYDVEGVYDGEAEYFIPIEMLGDSVKDFKHVEGEEYCISEEELNQIIDDYKKANGFS